MQDKIMSQEISDLDLSKVAALQQKRTLAFVNHFVITTVQFLNNFSKRCEQRLMLFERKIEKINATIVLLEAKLSSIPELNSASSATSTQENTAQANNTDTPKVIEEATTESEQKNNTEVVADVTIINDTVTEKENVKIKPEYEKFLKMVQVGVPAEAVKLKISLEGLDPSELDKILKK